MCFSRQLALRKNLMDDIPHKKAKHEQFHLSLAYTRERFETEEAENTNDTTFFQKAGPIGNIASILQFWGALPGLTAKQDRSLRITHRH